MKTFKKIAFVVLSLVVLSLLGGYLYFKNKFTPEANYLSVSGISNTVTFRWISDDSNPYAALLLPVRIKGIDQTFYMQLDSGSPSTLFYKKTIASIEALSRNSLQFDANQNRVSLRFSIGNMRVSSDRFSAIDYGNPIDTKNPDTPVIIGTIGTDLLEKRMIALDFKQHSCSFTSVLPDDTFTAFEFQKRKILLPASIGTENLKLLYDSGTSGYELITNRKEWERYKTANQPVKTEKGNSWGHTLTVLTAPTNRNISIGKQLMPLSEVTCIEGTSTVQIFLMKASGMQGMIGNKLFLNHTLIIDCKHRRFKVE